MLVPFQSAAVIIARTALEHHQRNQPRMGGNA
jgi:hypothetical protein